MRGVVGSLAGVTAPTTTSTPVESSGYRKLRLRVSKRRSNRARRRLISYL